jgi:coenzyme F420-reducing hydrogenase alpha subunit
VTFRPGGFSRLPSAAQLKDLKAELEGCIPDIQAVADVVLSVADKLPAFDRPTEYIALRHDKEYTFYHGEIGSTDTDETVPVQEFERVVNEYISPQSTAKWTKWHRDSYAVGALARYNLNHEFLNPLASQVAQKFGLEPGCCNPFFNNVAQIVEIAHVVEESIKLIDDLLAKGITNEFPKVTPKAGNGAGCVEAPRGILFHRYIFDAQGRCEGSNICIPTNQNHANIQKDFEAFVPDRLDEDPDLLKLHLEMLVRSYDPCISCSTH